MVGIIQEQHPDRCALFMQWKRMEFPIWVDALNLLEVSAVPITALIDEAGIVRYLGPSTDDYEAFLSAPSPSSIGDTNPATIPLAPDKFKATPEDTANALNYHAIVDFSFRENAVTTAIESFKKAAALEPDNGHTWFRLGVAYRRRFDSAEREPGDFSKAIESWTRALEIDPNQYIWRRRIQQFGPRLDKPYPFYDWVDAAREEIRARGETPLPLSVEPRGAEIAEPGHEFKEEPTSMAEPDPDGKIHRDTRYIDVETIVAPDTSNDSGAARVHVLLTPNPDAQAHWNNEAEPLVLWAEPSPGWRVHSNYASTPNPPQAIDTRPRTVEFEVEATPDAPEEGTLNLYALYYVCEDVDGVCYYLRQDFTVSLKR